jgi:serine/threonine-protein kinase RsbW
MTEPKAVPDLELEFPARPEFVRAARHAVSALARLSGASEEVVEDIKLAVSEACNTAVAANAEAGSEAVELRAFDSPAGLVIEVMDRGANPERTVSGPPEELDTGDLPFERALSLPIIRGLVDELAIAPRGDRGAVVRMTVSLEGQGR